MQITDPIADLLTRIRNASTAKHPSVDVPASNLKKAICQIIHGQQLVTGRKAQRLGFAARFHTLDFDCQRIHLLCSDRTRRGRHRALPFCT